MPGTDRDHESKNFIWSPDDFGPISDEEIESKQGSFWVRGKGFESYSDAREYLHHLNQFRSDYAAKKPRVLARRGRAYSGRRH
jgi:hypothetical protein